MTPDVRSAEWRAELRALAEAATPGPWNEPDPRDYRPGDGRVIEEYYDNDGRFIAAAREAVPVLLDAYERLLAERDRLREALRTLDDYLDLGEVLFVKSERFKWAQQTVRQALAETQEARDE